jgi:hypothetical protein
MAPQSMLRNRGLQTCPCLVLPPDQLRRPEYLQIDAVVITSPAFCNTACVLEPELGNNLV